MNEQILLHNLKEQVVNHEFFKGLNKEKIRILSLGDPSPSSGPDFQHSVIEIDGYQACGDIEVDVNASDWFRHGHHQNPKFDNVILHMFFRNDRPGFRTETIGGKRACNVLIDAREDSGEYLEEPSFKKRDFYRLLPCRKALMRRSASLHILVRSVLSLGVKRFLEKARVARSRIGGIDDPSAAFLKLLFAFLADPVNRPRFVDLSDKPWFTASLEARDPGLFARHIRLELPLLKILWSRKNIRPAGSPERRLRLFCRLLRDPAAFGLPSAIEKTWQSHSRDPELLQKELSRHLRDLGLSRSLSALSVANLILPFLYARHPSRRAGILSLYKGLAGNESNSKIDRFSDWPVPVSYKNSEAYQQGILGIYERYCSGQCGRCPLFPRNRGLPFPAFLKKTA